MITVDRVLSQITVDRVLSQKLRSRLWNGRYCYLLLLPVIANFIIFHYLPMAGLQIAFKDYNIGLGIAGSPWAGLKHFGNFFGSIYFWPLLRNTILLSVYQTLWSFPAPIILAILINEVKSPLYKRFAQTITYIPYFISVVILVSLINMMCGSPDGLINLLINNFGGENISFLEDPRYFRTIYIISGIWQSTGFGAIIFLAAITSIDPQLYEAAELDGAGRLAQIWHITLVELIPTIVILFIINMGSILNVSWLQVLLMQNDLNSPISDVLQTFVYKRGIMNSDYGYATAVGLFQSLIGFFAIIVSNKISKKVSDVYIF